MSFFSGLFFPVILVTGPEDGLICLAVCWSHDCRRERIGRDCGREMGYSIVAEGFKEVVKGNLCLQHAPSYSSFGRLSTRLDLTLFSKERRRMCYRSVDLGKRRLTRFPSRKEI